MGVLARAICLALLLPLHLPAVGGRSAAPAHAGHDDPTMGVHGMALFGGADALFASHLPLFRPPHDRRILLRIRLTDPTLDRRVRGLLAAERAQWTLVPERFALARLMTNAGDPIHLFRADLVRGHFERGGEIRLRAVEVEIVRVLENAGTRADAPPLPRATYRAIGEGRTWFLVKDLSGRPDFDHVVALAGPPRRRTVELPRAGIEPPALAALGRAAGARAVATVHYEVDDLR